MALFCAKNGQLQTVKGVFEGVHERMIEGIHFDKYEWIGTTLSTLEIHGGIVTSDTFSSDLHSLVVRAYRPANGVGENKWVWDKFYYPVWDNEDTKTSFATRCNNNGTVNVYAVFKQKKGGTWNYVLSFPYDSWKEVEFTWGSSNYIRSRGETSGGASTQQSGMNYTSYNDIRGLEMIFRLSNLSYSKIQLNRWYFQGANGTIDLFPCKLIKNITPNLSHDNKIHYAGETGLYNAIDGSFWALNGSIVTND